VSVPRVAFFDFSCCEGCQLQIANLEVELLDLLERIEIVNFREVMTEASDEYDIAFVEGSITRETEIPRLRKIRDNAGTLVAFGACAHLGGVNSLKNIRGTDFARRTVYGDDAHLHPSFPARPLSAVVKVDAAIPGCPVKKEEIVSTITALLAGTRPVLPDYSVCVECRLRENACIIEQGGHCLGPITRAGCNAWCPSAGRACYGCRGFLPESNVEGELEIFKRKGYAVEFARAEMERYNAYQLSVSSG
jgi:sulfhydrogenase subunit delta